MSAPLGHGLGGLIKWCGRDEWRWHVDEVMTDHFTPAMKAFGLEFEGIDEASCSASAPLRAPREAAR
ncbi:MAG: hypothetical protein JOZ17_03625 [Acetobacteraceae bacterium]|nr:hypothetical protein [Acetobacteraceae bacterium]